MSTILETLKKLEEDKRLLEKDSDLKELVLQEDQKPFSGKTIELSRNHFMALGLVMAGVIIGLVLGLKPSAKNELTHYSQRNSEKKPESLNKRGSEATVGIPLSNIPEHRPRYEENISENFPQAIENFLPPSVTVIPKSVAEPEVLPQGINEIRDLIQNAKLDAKQPESFGYPEDLATRGISIPQLKVKGIIFFSPGSSSNHIFVSTSESKNLKVRVGETVQAATLRHIESNRVVFSYRGENVHLRIGE